MYLSKIIILTTMVLTLFCNLVNAEQGHFNFKDVTGKAHSIAQYKGKWLLINYWATWCPPCLDEVPELVSLYDARKQKDVMVIGVVFDYPSEKVVLQYVDDMLMSYPVVLGTEGIAKRIGSPEVLPTTFIYNPKGELVKTKRGQITKSYIEDFIAEQSRLNPQKP